MAIQTFERFEVFILERLLRSGRHVFFFSSRRRHTRFDCDWSSDVCSSDLKAILVGLGLPTRQKARDLEIEVPSFRRDLAMEDDLVEEIVRVWGYDKLPSVVPGDRKSVV